MVTDEVGKLRWAWGQQVRGKLYFIPSVRWHCWFDDRKGIWPLKSWVLVCWWWRFVCTSYSSSWSLPLPSAREREREILIPSYWGCLGKCLWNECRVLLLSYCIIVTMSQMNGSHVVRRRRKKMTAMDLGSMFPTRRTKNRLTSAQSSSWFYNIVQISTDV